jgi:hypothetical protein
MRGVIPCADLERSRGKGERSAAVPIEGYDGVPQAHGTGPVIAFPWRNRVTAAISTDARRHPLASIWRDLSKGGRCPWKCSPPRELGDANRDFHFGVA